MLAAGQPLLSAAQETHQIASDIDLDQILDFVVAIAKIPGTRNADSRSLTRHSPDYTGAAPDVRAVQTYCSPEKAWTDAGLATGSTDELSCALARPELSQLSGTAMRGAASTG
jgi:hypothetical protein